MVSQFSGQVLRYDGTTGAFVGVFLSGAGVTDPTRLTAGPDGRLYLSNYGTNTVTRFDAATGAYLGTFVAVTAPAGSVTGITFGPDGDLYVADRAGNAVRRFSGISGAQVGTFASGGPLDNPENLQFGPDGDLYVSNLGAGTVSRYDRGGTFLGNVLTGLATPAQFAFTDLARNVISGNAGAGVVVRGDASDGNTIQGNFIGTNAAGTAALGNKYAGVSVTDADDTVVGGDTAGARNLISGSFDTGAGYDGYGVAVDGSADNTRVSGNWIGLNAAGDAVLANVHGGIAVFGPATNTDLGGITAGRRNVIVGSGGGTQGRGPVRGLDRHPGPRQLHRHHPGRHGQAGGGDRRRVRHRDADRRRHRRAERLVRRQPDRGRQPDRRQLRERRADRHHRGRRGGRPRQLPRHRRDRDGRPG